MVYSDEHSKLQLWLQGFIEREGAVAGTVHELRTGTAPSVLELVASVHIPASVIEATRTIPKGKGMAGIAWEQERPVQTCNLKTDDSGNVRPGARAVDAQAAVAIPVHDAQRQLRAVVGIAFRGERELSASELERLEKAAAELPG